MRALLYGLVAVVLWLNIASTYQVLRAPIYERRQKIWLLLLIWLVPLIGAWIVLEVIRGTKKYRRESTASSGDMTPALVSFLMLSWIIDSHGPRPDGAYGDVHYNDVHHGYDGGGFDGGGV